MATKLLRSVVRGDVAGMENAIRFGASVNQVDASVHTFCALHVACQHSNVQSVEWLLRHGADHSVRSARGWTPLHVCAIRGGTHVAKMLVKDGADVNARDGRGCTPGHLACVHNHSALLHMLLCCGLNGDSKDRRGWNMAHHACYHGNLDCLKLLHSSCLQQTDLEGNTPLHLACRTGQLSCVKQLMSSSAGCWNRWITAKNFKGNTAKREAVEGRRGVVVGYMEALEAQEPSQHEESSFPAHLAACTGDLEHVRRLVEGGVVELQEVDVDGNTLLHKAIGHVGVMRWLLEQGAVVEATNDHGETCVDVASRMGETRCLGVLQQHMRETGKTKPRDYSPHLR